MSESTWLSDEELCVLAAAMADAGDVVGLLHLNAVLTLALYPMTGRRGILPGLKLAGEEKPA